MDPAPPIACTLRPGDFRDRLAWIGELTRDALRAHERDGLTLRLRYAPEAAARVRELVRREQDCCAFLRFVLEEDPNAIRLTITAPESARDSAEALFDDFVTAHP